MAKSKKSAKPESTTEEMSSTPEQLDVERVPTSADLKQVVQFDPAMITVGDNTRLKLKQSRVDALAASILEVGVLEPVGVEEMPDGSFSLIYGRYRYHAVAKLNADGHPDITLPGIVHANLDPVTRLKMQVSENLERETLSLVDKALAMKAYLDQGLSKVEVRSIFASAGGRKGNAVQPMSNVYLNDHLGILTFSKTLQDKIDEGILGMAAVKKLLKVEPSQRDAVVKSIEASRAIEAAKDERDEDRFVKAENARMEAEEKEESEAKALIDKKAEVDGLFKLGKELDKAIKTTNLKHSLKFNKDEAAAWQQEMKDATTAKMENDKAYKKATGTLAKMKEKASKAKEEKPEPTPKPTPAPKTSISGAELDKAVQEVTGETSFKKLKVSELEAELKDMRKIGGDSPAFVKIIDAFSKLITGELTTKEAANDIAEVIEVVLPVKPVSRRAAK